MSWDQVPLRRADRRHAELLHEVRVAQTGAQVLLAGLLTLAFTPPFADLSSVQRGLYVVGLLLAAAAATVLIAPVPFHRILFQRRLKPQVVLATARFVLLGLVLFFLALVAATYLVADVLLGTAVAVVLTTATTVWFGAWWFIIPLWTHRTPAPPA